MKADRIGAIATLGLGIILWSQGAPLPPGLYGAPGPGFFPVWVGVALIIASLPLLIRPAAMGKTVRELLPAGRDGRRVLLLLAELVAYTLLLEPLGFILATSLLFLGMLQLAERGRWPVAVATSLATVLAFYWIFVKFFGLILPGGLLPL